MPRPAGRLVLELSPLPDDHLSAGFRSDREALSGRRQRQIFARIANPAGSAVPWQAKNSENGAKNGRRV